MMLTEYETRKKIEELLKNDQVIPDFKVNLTQEQVITRFTNKFELENSALEIVDEIDYSLHFKIWIKQDPFKKNRYLITGMRNKPVYISKAGNGYADIGNEHLGYMVFNPGILHTSVSIAFNPKAQLKEEIISFAEELNIQEGLYQDPHQLAADNDSNQVNSQSIQKPPKNDNEPLGRPTDKISDEAWKRLCNGEDRKVVLSYWQTARDSQDSKLKINDRRNNNPNLFNSLMRNRDKKAAKEQLKM